MNNALYAVAALLLVASLGLKGAESASWLMPGLIGSLVLSVAVCLQDIRRGTLVTALVCAASSAYLFQGKLNASDFTTCNIGAAFDCASVNNSKWSEAFGIPITLFGMAFYLGLAGAAIGKPSTPNRFDQANALFAAFNLFYSIVLAGVSMSEYGKLCPVCATMYVGNAILLWNALRGLKASGTSLSDSLIAVPFSNPFVTLTLVFFGVTFVGNQRWQDVVRTKDAAATGPVTANSFDGAFSTPPGAIQVDGDEGRMGRADAPYTVVEFADFGCPHCAEAAVVFEELVEKEPDLQVLFKPFPLTGLCNPLIPAQPDDPGQPRCDAAVAVECASRQGKFTEMAHAIFTNQRWLIFEGGLNAESLKTIADGNGIDYPKFEACLADPSALEAVKRHAAAGGPAGVQGTPALFLKGTHGDRFVHVERAPHEIARIIAAHKEKVPMPEPTPAH
jgi:protein-disulfide isomerase/uncharacterized membrane protein